MLVSKLSGENSTLRREDFVRLINPAQESVVERLKADGKVTAQHFI